MQLSAAGVEKKGYELFESLGTLHRLHEKKEAEKTEAQITADKMRSSGFLYRLQMAAAQNKIEWKLDEV